MKISTLMIIGLLAIQGFLLGQVDKSKKYLYLFSDTVLYGKIIEYKKPFLGEAQLLLDSKKIRLETVKFYKNETGFHANTKNLNFSGSSIFTERIREGRLNLYENESTHYNPGHYSATTGMYTGGDAWTTIKNYYNEGFGDLKKANYQNLSIDLEDNAESLDYLKKFKTVNDAQTGLYIAGGAMVIGGLATLIGRTSNIPPDEESPDDTANIVVIGVGAGCFWISYFLGFTKPDHLRDAFDAYNR